MANNCLVTKLKSVVNNDSLEELGVIRISFSIPSDPYSANYNSFKVNAETEATLSDSTKNIYRGYDGQAMGSSITSSTGLDFYLLDPGDYDVIIKPKYNLINEIKIFSHVSKPIDLKEFEYSSVKVLKNRTSSNVYYTGNLSSIKNLDMTSFDFDGSTELKGVLEDDCGSMIHLTDFKLIGTQVTGDIVEFVRRQVKAGRTSYTFTNLAYLGAATGIKFNGQTIRNRQTSTLTWQNNSSDNTKIDITLQTGTQEQGDAPMTATVPKLG